MAPKVACPERCGVTDGMQQGAEACADAGQIRRLARAVDMPVLPLASARKPPPDHGRRPGIADALILLAPYAPGSRLVLCNRVADDFDAVWHVTKVPRCFPLLTHGAAAGATAA